MGWLTGWAKRIKLTLDHDDIDAALSNFPVLIYLSSSSGIGGIDVTCVFDEIGANSLKIAVTKSDGTTECKVEIEKWDNGSEQAWLWVKVPDIDHLTDTVIYLYYDNTHADNNANVGVKESAPAMAVWDVNFMLVHHMNDTASPIKDSTTNNIDCAEVGNPTYQQSGKINDAIDFDGNDVFDFGTETDLEKQIFTLEAWIKTDDYTRSSNGGIAYGAIFAGAAYYGFCLDITSNNIRMRVTDGSSVCGVTTLAIGDNEFHHYCFTYSAGQVLSGYKDGQEVAGSPHSCGLVVRYSLGSWRKFLLGARTGGTYGIDGKIDEVRFSDTDRTGAWIKATYESGRDNLITYGSEETPSVAEASSSSIVPLMQILNVI